MNTYLKAFWYCHFVLLFVITACQKDDPNPNVEAPTSGIYQVDGRVTDINGEGISGATVSSNGKTVLTGSLGQFTLDDVSAPNDRLVIKSERNGYFTATATEIPSSGTSIINLTMEPYPSAKPINSGTGGEATATDGSSVNLPANGLVDESGNAYTGSVSVLISHLDPSTPTFGQLAQGADMQGQDAEGNTVTLHSYGIVRVELANAAGNKLQLANGKTATITIPISSSMLSTAPATIPLYYFDETAGIWKEDGEATKNGSNYVGSVSHFTDWSSTTPSARGLVTGKVIGCNNEPVSNIYVKIGPTYAYTDANGIFSKYIPSGIDFVYKVDFARNNGITSNQGNATGLTPGQTLDLGNISLTTCASYIVGSIVDCDDQPVAAWVKSNSSISPNYIYSTDGQFKIRVPRSTDITITAHKDNGEFGSAIMRTSSHPDSLNRISTIKICPAEPVAVGVNSFTINGDGFTNNNIILQITDPNYSPSTDVEFAIAITKDNNTPSTIGDRITGKSLGINAQAISSVFNKASITINIKPFGLGTYSLGSADSNYVYITAEDSVRSYVITYWARTYEAVSGSLTITRYDEVGGLVEGTFSGTFKKFSSVTEVTITNGKFSMVRLANNVQPRMAATAARKKK